MPARALILALALGACGDNAPDPFADPPSIEVVSMPALPNRQLDLLLMIDDSPGGDEMQVPFSDALPGMFDQLAAAAGVLPDLHVGVITSDLGTVGSDDPTHPGPGIGQVGNGGCLGHGKDGAMLLSGAAVTDAYLVDEADGVGGRRGNYQGDRSLVLRQMIRAGSGGCGFEQPLAAVRRSLVNPTNGGFLRPSAQLAVILLTDEDDCSFRNARLLAADEPLGPLQSFRCTTQGVVCNEPIDLVGPKTGCHAREDSAYVEPIAKTVDTLRAVKSDPSLLVVAAIAGTPTPFAVEQRQPPGGGTAISALAHSCTPQDPMGGTRAADPAVRIADVTSAFESRGVLTSVCTPDLGAQLSAIGRALEQALGVACLDTTKLRDSNTEPGIQPACEVTEVRDGVESLLPACDADGDCFVIEPDATACADTADHLRLTVHYATPPTATTYIRARCEVP